MSLNGTVWAPIGPSPIDQGAISANGQVTAIAINPNNPKIIYIGTAWGGVWLTRDGGNTWTPIFDRAPSLGVGDPGALAIDPVNTNIVYVGTSSREGSQFSGEATQPPAGLFKSTDGGASWIRLGSGYPSGPPSNASILFNQRITVVIVDPANTQTLYLASSAGLFVSTDGGFNWTQGVAPAGDVRSLALDATSPAGARILYAGVSGVGVVQSTDGGRNWHVILNAATPAVAAALAGGGFGKVVVALAPPASPASPAGIQVLYVTMVGTGSRAAYRRPLPEHGSGQYLERSSRHGTGGNNRLAPGRLQLPHGRRSAIARRRDWATSSISATNSRRGPLTRAPASQP